MTQAEKKRKAALVAIAYYLEQEKAAAATHTASNKGKKSWAKAGREMIMKNRAIVQRRGRLLRSA